jgi:hypothetical protein
MDIVLRVKRSPSDAPIDFISLNKKPKNFESYFNSLSLSPKLILKRAIRDDPQKFDPNILKPPPLNSKRDEQRLKIINHFRNTLIPQESLIYYNGKPLKTEALKSSEDTIIDEYYLCEEEQEHESILHNILIDFIDSSEDEIDSQDSNCEEHPWNDYPDDESSENDSEKSIDYEDYEFDEFY